MDYTIRRSPRARRVRVSVNGSGEVEVVLAADPRFAELLEQGGYERSEVPESHRAIVLVRVTRVADSCGYGVPLMDYVGERPHQAASSRKRVRVHGPDAYVDYQREKNAVSIDGLPAVEV